MRVQRVEATFSPLPFDAEAARQYGIIAAEVISTGRKPRGRVADLMIASIAAANRLPLFTTSPADFHGLESVVTVVPVPTVSFRSIWRGGVALACAAPLGNGAVTGHGLI
jgi:predicted nucleic acid-binding protein